MQFFRELVSIIPPPAHPIAPGNPQKWLEIETQINCRLPNDFKAYIDTYGSGVIFADWTDLCVHNPIADKKSNWLESITLIHKTYEWWQEDEPDVYPYPIFPKEGGVLTCGYSGNGYELFFLTKGAPDEWSMLLCEGRGSGVEEFHCGLTEFLVRGIHGDLQLQFDDEFFSSDPEHLTFLSSADC